MSTHQLSKVMNPYAYVEYYQKCHWFQLSLWIMLKGSTVLHACVCLFFQFIFNQICGSPRPNDFRKGKYYVLQCLGGVSRWNQRITNKTLLCYCRCMIVIYSDGDDHYWPTSSGHRVSVPNTKLRPRTCETSSAAVTPSWLMVPTAPRMESGDTSELYMGVSPVYRPGIYNQRPI